MLLLGCTATVPTVTQISVWPNIPDVPPVPPIRIKPVEFSIPNADSFIALDYNNWFNYQFNLQSVRLQLQLYQQRIDEVNQQRAQWRKLNEGNNASSNSTK